MSEKNNLGIHLSRAGATVVLIGGSGDGGRIEQVLFVPAPQTDDGVAAEPLARLVRKACEDGGMKWSGIAMSLGRSYFTQHAMHSQFSDSARVAQTVKFDAEDVVAVDTATLAVTFEIVSSDDKGSALMVYAAQKKELSAILGEFTAEGLEPLVIEPDTVTLARWLDGLVPAERRYGAVHVLLQGGSCTLVIWTAGRRSPHIRTVLMAEPAAAAAVAREVTVTAASIGLASTAVEKIRLFDAGGTFDVGRLRELTRATVEPLELAAIPSGENAPPTAVFAAAGAALVEPGASVADFREDFCPHLGRRQAMGNAIKAICTAVFFIIIGYGAFLQFQLMGVNGNRAALKELLAVDYRPVMMTDTMPEMSTAARNLGSALQAAREKKSGIITGQGQETVTSLLTYVFESLNSLKDKVDFQIDSVSVTSKAITLIGSTGSREQTLTLIQSIDGHPRLQDNGSNYEEKNRRDVFNMKILPARRR